MQSATRSKHTTTPVEAPAHAALLTRPEFLRLPKPGKLCPYTGMARSALNELVLPTPRNNYEPPVRSFCLRKRGARTGIRLVCYESLAEHIRAHAEQPGDAPSSLRSIS